MGCGGHSGRFGDEDKAIVSCSREGNWVSMVFFYGFGHGRVHFISVNVNSLSAYMQATHRAATYYLSGSTAGLTA